MLIISKEMHYNPPDFENETPIKKNLVMKLLPIANSPERFSSVKIVRTDVVSEEYFFNPGILGPKEYSGFHTEKGDYDVNFPKGSEILLELAFYVDPLIRIKSRSVYNGLDLLGDVGGLFDGLR